MKIALAPDLHCFYSTYDKKNEQGIGSRQKEWKSVGVSFLKQCQEHKVDVVLFPGDFFINPKPPANNFLLIARLFASLRKAGIYVMGITGNHDIAGVGKKTMNDIVATIGGDGNWCHSDFGIVMSGDVGFAFLPFMKAPAITAHNPDFANMELSEHLIKNCADMKEQLDKAGAKKTILCGHWSIQGAVTSSGKTMEHTTNGIETVLPLGELVNQGWSACLFGHIHKPQVLCESKPFIAYSGCFQRINIGEANDDRGFYIYDTETDKHIFLSLPSIEMKTFSKEITSPEAFESLIDEIKHTNIEGKIVSAKYIVNKDNFNWIDKKAVIKALEAGNPLSIAGITPRIVEEARQRDITLTEALDSETALSKWLSNKDNLSEEQINKVMLLFKKYTEEELESGSTDEPMI